MNRKPRPRISESAERAIAELERNGCDADFLRAMTSFPGPWGLRQAELKQIDLAIRHTRELIKELGAFFDTYDGAALMFGSEKRRTRLQGCLSGMDELLSDLKVARQIRKGGRGRRLPTQYTRLAIISHVLRSTDGRANDSLVADLLNEIEGKVLDADAVKQFRARHNAILERPPKTLGPRTPSSLKPPPKASFSRT